MQLAHSSQVYARLQKRFNSKVNRKRAIRYGLLAVNLVLVTVTVWFVVRNPSSTIAATGILSNNTSSNSGSAIANPLDQLSSADIAVTVARLAGLPESTAVTNQADTENAELAVAQASNSLVAKPQVVATAFKSNKDIKTYVVKAGDNVASLVSQFGVTSDSIRWSNNLSGNYVTAGQTLYIPPVNGIVYIVKSGDTPASLATTYSTTSDKIIAYNDAEISGLSVGERIIIPDGQKPAPVIVRSSFSYASGFPWGGASPIYGYNGYDYGYCTWYVATRIAVPSNWGNASSWAYYATLSGWTVSSIPQIGAIAQTPAGGEGHVAIVTGVSPDGRSVEISDMNGLAGWGAVGTGWESTSKYPNFIYH